MAVFVVDKNKKPLMSCSEKRAKKLLTNKRATIHKRIPFTIRLKGRKLCDSALQDQVIKIDPGSRTSGLAVLRKNDAVFLAEIKHKTTIKDSLDSRRSLRRGRRSRNTRYRKARFLNRKVEKGWLPVSLLARVNQTINIIKKLKALTYISNLAVENVKFDTQLMENENITGVEYQNGTLVGYEIKEYLLEKYQRTCAYCEGKSKDVILNVDHYIPRNPKVGDSGTNRISNLVLSCRDCNKMKNNFTPEDWAIELGKNKKDINKIRIKNIVKLKSTIKKPLKDAAMLNSTRKKILQLMYNFSLPVDFASGAKTKMNRIALKLPKTHYYDAYSVGYKAPEIVGQISNYFLIFKAKGRGVRQIVQTDKFGFPKQYRGRNKQVFGFQTGDIVKFKEMTGRITAVKTGSFYFIKDKKRISFNYKKCVLVQKNDGWDYEIGLVERVNDPSIRLSDI